MQGMNKGIMNKRAGRYIRIDLDIPAFFLLTVTICNPAKAQKAVEYIPLLFNCKKRSSVNSNTLRDAQIRSILLHIALAAAEGFQLLMN